MTPRISTQTAETIGNLIKTLGAQKMLPSTEAAAAAAVLLAAAKSPPGDPRPPGDKPRMMTTAQVAKCLACSRKTVMRIADDNVLTRRYLRAGNAKSLRFSSVEVERLCEVATPT